MKGPTLWRWNQLSGNETVESSMCTWVDSFEPKIRTFRNIAQKRPPFLTAALSRWLCTTSPGLEHHSLERRPSQGRSWESGCHPRPLHLPALPLPAQTTGHQRPQRLVLQPPAPHPPQAAHLPRPHRRRPRLRHRRQSLQQHFQTVTRGPCCLPVHRHRHLPLRRSRWHHPGCRRPPVSFRGPQRHSHCYSAACRCLQAPPLPPWRVAVR